MINRFTYTNEQTFFQKLKSIDWILIFCILLIGFISFFSMYSTDGGEIKFHTKNHILRFGIFFSMMFVIGFINIKFWHSVSYLFYLIVLVLLIAASFYGITASGSQRWINLYFINLQPSELMKIAIIIFLARYYHRVQPEAVNSIKKFIIPFIILIVPILLVLSQPDLGTSVLIALSGIAVCGLGHSHPSLSKVIAEQSAKLIHTSNVYRISFQEKLAEKLSPGTKVNYPEEADTFNQSLVQHAKFSSGMLGINIGKNRDTSLGRAREDYVSLLSALHPFADYLLKNMT